MPSPDSQRIRAGFNKNPIPDDRPLDIQRREWEAMALQTPLPPGTIIEKVNADGIVCERVTCGTVKDEQVLLYLHGGGFNSGSPKTHRDVAARISGSAGIPLLLPDYRLAPEYSFPAAVEDVMGVYRWLLKNGFTADQIAMGGDSAGGGLALSVLLTLHKGGDVLPAAAVLLSPMADMALAGESMTSRAALDPLITEADLRQAVGYYIGEGDPKNPLASPVYADLSGLPPLLIHVGDHEMLLSDSTRLAQNAEVGGIETILSIWSEMWHFFQAWAADLPEARESLAQIGAWLCEKLAI